MDMLRKKIAQLEEKVQGFKLSRQNSSHKLSTAERQNSRLKSELDRIRDELSTAQSRDKEREVRLLNIGFLFKVKSEFFNDKLRCRNFCRNKIF